MKPISAIVADGIAVKNIFSVREINTPYFSPEFHFHEECQLVYIIESSGRRIIGDVVDQFESGELIFLGSNIPHVWYNNKECFNENDNSHARSIALFIAPKELLEHLSAFEDIHIIQQLLVKSQRGMIFSGQAKEKIVCLLKQMLVQHGIQRYISLLEILYLMSITIEYKLIVSSNYSNYYQYRDNEKMDRVFKYIFDHFKEEISLSKISDIAGMHPHAFCRFFKIRTQKSFTHFINEIRIAYACKLLAGKEDSITQIAYECGFNNVSNFNRFFKVIKKVSPREYRKQLLLD
jgi:AraC-like DNA-binding protein